MKGIYIAFKGLGYEVVYSGSDFDDIFHVSIVFEHKRIADFFITMTGSFYGLTVEDIEEFDNFSELYLDGNFDFIGYKSDRKIIMFGIEEAIKEAFM